MLELKEPLAKQSVRMAPIGTNIHTQIYVFMIWLFSDSKINSFIPTLTVKILYAFFVKTINFLVFLFTTENF